jgi:hypothetical protein
MDLMQRIRCRYFHPGQGPSGLARQGIFLECQQRACIPAS